MDKIEFMNNAWEKWHGDSVIYNVMPRPNPSFERGFEAGIEYVEGRENMITEGAVTVKEMAAICNTLITHGKGDVEICTVDSGGSQYDAKVEVTVDKGETFVIIH